jgi:hypothetical protein
VQDAQVPIVAAAEPVWRGRVKRALLVGVAVSPFVLAFALELPLCPSAALLGIPCPGCGLTRATFAALDGRIGDALHLHPLVFLLTPLYVGFLVATAWSFVRGPAPIPQRPSAFGKIVGVVMGVALVLMIGVWVARFFGVFGGPVPVERLRSF